VVITFNKKLVSLIAEIGVTVAAIGLIFTGWSFYRLGKTEELRSVEAIYRDIVRNLKEFRLLEAESPKAEELIVHTKKLQVMLSETFADINWLCILILKGRIKDLSLINVFKNAIIDWSYVFEERMSEKVNDNKIFTEFKILYRKYRHERHKNA
jgi:hypothetical protein